LFRSLSPTDLTALHGPNRDNSKAFESAIFQHIRRHISRVASPEYFDLEDLKQMSRLVSILIPAYNAAQWIEETLASATNQTWPNLEIIVIDDGSSDSTLKLASQFLDRGVRVVSQKNMGAAAARNHALSLSNGDFIQWLDSDDLLSPNKIADQMALADRSSDRILLSCGWAYFMYRQSKARFIPTSLWCDLSPLEWYLRKWEGNHHMQTATWLVSRDITTAAGPWDTRLLGDDDGEYFSRIIKASHGIKFAAGSKVYYRISGGNRLSYIGRSSRKVEAQFLGMKLQISYLLSMSSDVRAKAACVNYLQTWLPHFYPEYPDIVTTAQKISSELGGHLTTPTLSWKYAWIRLLLGWNAAKRTQRLYNHRKSEVLRGLDRMLFRLEGNS
jgi:glycosyltransferase involved in cell wall biosynthesis